MSVNISLPNATGILRILGIINPLFAVVGSIVDIEVVANNCELCAVVLRSTLSHGHNDGLVVRAGGQCADAVVSRWQATLDIRRESTLTISSVIDTLEESKLTCCQLHLEMLHTKRERTWVGSGGVVGFRLAPRSWTVT